MFHGFLILQAVGDTRQVVLMSDGGEDRIPGEGADGGVGYTGSIPTGSAGGEAKYTEPLNDVTVNVNGTETANGTTTLGSCYLLKF